MCLRLAKGKNILHVIDDKFQVGQSSKEISQEEEENGNFWVSLQSISNISRLDFDHRTFQKCHSFLAMFPSKHRSEAHIECLILTYYLFTTTSIQVLDLLQLYFPYFRSSLWINNFSQLRYLALYIGAFPGSLSILSTLKTLQTLILRSAKPFVVYLILPKAPQLRELCILNRSSFHFINEEENLKLENLTTLSWLSDFCCNNEALMVRIPNVKKLGVRYEEAKRGDSMHPIDLLHTLSHLEQLEDIRFYGYDLFDLLRSPATYSPKTNPKLCQFCCDLRAFNFMENWKHANILDQKSNATNVVDHWIRPVAGRIKLNTDASLDLNNNEMGLGWILRDDEGKFLAAKNVRLDGIYSVKEAEAISFMEALSWLKDTGIGSVDVEMDSHTLF